MPQEVLALDGAKERYGLVLSLLWLLTAAETVKRFWHSYWWNWQFRTPQSLPCVKGGGSKSRRDCAVKCIKFVSYLDKIAMFFDKPSVSLALDSSFYTRKPLDEILNVIIE